MEISNRVATGQNRLKHDRNPTATVGGAIQGSEGGIRIGDPLEFVFSLPQRMDLSTVQFLVLRRSGNRREFVQLQSNRPSPLGVGTAKDVSGRSALPYEKSKTR